MKNKLVFACVIFVLLAIGAGAGSLVYSAIYVASWVHRVILQQWIPYASLVILALIVIITMFFTYRFMKSANPGKVPDHNDHDVLPMSVIVPALNEERTLKQCIESFAAAEYPRDRLEVIIAHEVPPRCKDTTPEIARKMAEKYPWVRVAANGGSHAGSKAGAINNCLEQATGKIIGIYDADHVIQKDALIRASLQFARSPELDCLGGKVMVRNKEYNAFTMLVGNENTVMNNFSRYLSETFTGTHLIYGSNVFIKKDTLMVIGGFDEQSLTEDCDLGMKLIYDNYNTKIDYSIKSYEQPAIGPRDWWHQRVRWTRGSIDVQQKYIRKNLATHGINRKCLNTILLYSLGTGGLLFSVVLIGFIGFMMYMHVLTPLILFICCAPLAVLFAAESIQEFKEGRGSVLDTFLSIFVRPWLIYGYSLVGVYAVVLDVLDAERVWHENRRI